MTESIDAYWSFRSPYSYLATPDLLRLREDYDVEVNLRVVLPIAVRSKKALFDPSNMKPVMYIIRDGKLGSRRSSRGGSGKGRIGP